MKQKVNTGLAFALIAVLAGAVAIFALSGKEPQVNVEGKKIETASSSLPAEKKSLGTKDDVSLGWKTYENKTYKFKLQYPANFKLEESKFPGEANFDLQGTSVFGLMIGTKICEGCTPPFVMIYKNFSQKEPLREPAGMDPVAKADSKVGGIKAKRYDAGGGGVTYVVVNKGLRYEIGVTEITKKVEKEAFTKMLQTFQFTN